MEPETQQPEQSPRKRRLKRIAKWCGIIALFGVLGLFSVESWRQYRISQAVDEYEVLLAEVDKRILKGQTPEEYFRNRVEGTNGWHVFKEMQAKCNEIEDELELGEPSTGTGIRAGCPSLQIFATWAETLVANQELEASWNLTDEDLWFYLDKSFPLVALASNLQAYDSIVELPTRPDLTNEHIRYSVLAFPVLQARIVAFFHLKLDVPEVWREFQAVISISEKLAYPSAIIGLTVNSVLRRSAWALAKYAALTQQLPSDVSAFLMNAKPEHLRLLSDVCHACAGEPVVTMLTMDFDQLFSYGGWFGWMFEDSKKTMDYYWTEVPSPFWHKLETQRELNGLFRNNLNALKQLENGVLPDGALSSENKTKFPLSWSKITSSAKLKARKIDLLKCAVKLQLLRQQQGGKVFTRDTVKSELGSYSGIEATWTTDTLELQMVFDDVAKWKAGKALSGMEEASEDAFREEYPGISLPLK